MLRDRVSRSLRSQAFLEALRARTSVYLGLPGAGVNERESAVTQVYQDRVYSIFTRKFVVIIFSMIILLK